ncbi:hypothetical protein MO767_19240 [Pseudomonas sp. UYIF39]|uniref:hypothetical protein n=1 Tax=Pseudomonas sp. UYIF39 TaxID=1630747 RepID=UPI00249E6B31|nr:hypothetical protein [Pseudomonas sp. UYIF39]MDI3356463.1 hypothetical protein [Pseudomonas sp. UYIF39]
MVFSKILQDQLPANRLADLLMRWIRRKKDGKACASSWLDPEGQVAVTLGTVGTQSTLTLRMLPISDVLAGYGHNR